MPFPSKTTPPPKASFCNVQHASFKAFFFNLLFIVQVKIWHRALSRVRMVCIFADVEGFLIALFVLALISTPLTYLYTLQNPSFNVII